MGLLAILWFVFAWADAPAPVPPLPPSCETVQEAWSGDRGFGRLAAPEDLAGCRVVEPR